MNRCVQKSIDRIAETYILRIFQVDAFTDKRFTGNPASVILDADGHSDITLMSIAREFPHAEVAFVFAATSANHDVRLRFFNARKEAPFVGHATVAAHTVLLAVGRRGSGLCRQHSGTGVIEIMAQDSMIEFRQTTPDLDCPLPLKTTLRVAEALHLPATQLHESMPARIARKGSNRLLVPISDPRALDSLTPNFESLTALGAELGTDGFFVFALTRADDTLSTESRMFCPALGIPEDPVSGNAHAMLATYLWECGQIGQIGQIGKETKDFIGYQGRQMRRPGQVNVRIEIDQGKLIAAHVGGKAVIVSEGTLTI